MQFLHLSDTDTFITAHYTPVVVAPFPLYAPQRQDTHKYRVVSEINKVIEIRIGTRCDYLSEWVLQGVMEMILHIALGSFRALNEICNLK